MYFKLSKVLLFIPSKVGVVTRLWAGRKGGSNSIPGRDKRILSQAS